MTEQNIKDFFMVNEKNIASYNKVRNNFSDSQIEENPELLVIEILKQTFGYPISFFDSGKEDNINLTKEKSDSIYESFANDILKNYYEDLYDFTQDFSNSLPCE